MEGTRVAIVGGSIAGCAAAIALQRAGCQVVVYERSTNLEDRGSGIAIPLALRDQLISAGYLNPDYATGDMGLRRWMIDDGTPSGRLLWTQKSEAATNNWGNLWRSLRAQVPDEIYHAGVLVERISEDGQGVVVETSDGLSSSYNALIGADGYRSEVRKLLVPDSTPRFADYVLWRGNYEESRVGDPSLIEYGDQDQSWFTVVFPGGHGVIYMIPGFDNRADVGHRRVNWAIYAQTPEGRDFTSPTSIPPGEVGDDLYAHLDRLLSEHFPEQQETLIRTSRREEVSLQPIYDEPLSVYARDRLLLVGDAGTVTRPHTGSGATKALQDALALELIAQRTNTWEDLAAAYNSERVTEGNRIVELGRRIGEAQVTRTPDWNTMTSADFEAWTAATLAGESLYFWGASEEPAQVRG